MNKDFDTILWSNMELPSWGTVYVASSQKGYCYIGGPNESFEDMKLYILKHFPHYELVKSHSIVPPIKKEMTEFFRGNRQDFTIPLEFRGTLFQQSVWNELKNILYGQTMSYTQIAENIGRPKAVRAVASAIGANPISIIIPCHRVISKNGNIGGYRGGIINKKKILELEKKNISRNEVTK